MNENTSVKTNGLEIKDETDLFVLTDALADARDGWQAEADHIVGTVGLRGNATAEQAARTAEHGVRVADYAARAEAMRVQLEEQV